MSGWNGEVTAKFPFSTGNACGKAESSRESNGYSASTTRGAPAKRHSLFSWEREATKPFFFFSGWSKRSTETVFLELNVYLNMWLTFLSLLQGQYSLSNGSALFGWILSPEMNGQHQNLLHWQWNHNTEMPPESRDQCSNTHTHTYTNKKVLNIIMLK